MNDTPTLGFAHFLAQGDFVSKALLVILLGMSVVSWTLILVKGITHFIRSSRAERFLKMFWEAPSMQAVAKDIAAHGVHDPFSRVTANALQAIQHYARTAPSNRMADAGTTADLLTRTIKKVLDEETVRLENGLSVLATVGATAPFFGLFGTVWGVYHALVNIGLSGSGSLDKVAGPVGEALIMTGLGLAVALPAVIGFNWLTRRNRVLTARLDAFAFELFTFLSSGKTLSGHTHVDNSKPQQAALASPSFQFQGRQPPRRRPLTEGSIHHGLCQF